MKTGNKVVLGLLMLAVCVCLAGAGVAVAEEATFGDVAGVPGQILAGPGDFLHKVLTTPVENTAWHHDMTGSKPVLRMLYCAPKPTLRLEGMR